MIKRTWETDDVLVDPHTADGLTTARRLRRTGAVASEPMIVLETALPVKFAETITEAVGFQPERPPSLEGLEDLPRRVQVMPPDVDQVKDYIETHAGA